MIERLFRIFTWAILGVGGAAIASSPGEEPAYWPRFRGPHGDGVSPSEGLLAQWPAGGPPLVWHATGAGRGYSSFSIAGSKLFTMGDAPSTADDKDEYLLCFDVRTGSQLWQAHLGQAWAAGPDNWQSSRSTPTLDEDRVYVLTAHGDLVCARTADGRIVWRKNLRDDLGGKKGDGWGYGESVLVDGPHLICTPGGETNTMVALDKRTGDLVWSASRDGDRGAGHASIQVSHVGGIKVYVQTTAQGALGVRARDGELMWSYEIEKTTAVIPNPIVRGDLVFFVAGYNRGGALLHQVPSADGNVDVEEIYPLNRRLQNKHGGVVLVGDQLYGDSGDSGVPYCADFLTGELRWKQRGSGTGSASIVAAEGHLYIWFSNSTIVLAKATPDGYEEVSSLKVESGDADPRPTWAHPVIADQKLFLRQDDHIFCYDLGG